MKFQAHYFGGTRLKSLWCQFCTKKSYETTTKTMRREGGGGLSKVTSFKIPSQEYLLERGDIYVCIFFMKAQMILICGNFVHL